MVAFHNPVAKAPRFCIEWSPEQTSCRIAEHRAQAQGELQREHVFDWDATAWLDYNAANRRPVTSALENIVKSQSVSYRLLALVLRVALLVSLVGAGWIVYKRLPNNGATNLANGSGQATIQIILQTPPDMGAASADIPIEISPVDIVAVRHEFFVEPRAGQRFDEFLHQRMNGRTMINARLDSHGRTSVIVPPGDWWVHAILSGEVDLEWRLHVTITGARQVIELTQQNAYTRSKSF
jgi:hypothetical protein